MKEKDELDKIPAELKSQIEKDVLDNKLKLIQNK